MRLVYADDVKELLNGLESLPWEEQVDELVDKLPTAELPLGKEAYLKWDQNAIDWGIGAWVCSDCNSRNDNLPRFKTENPLQRRGSQFCPVCGAKIVGVKMVGGQE